jgi:hypothetical protein
VLLLELFGLFHSSKGCLDEEIVQEKRTTSTSTFLTIVTNDLSKELTTPSHPNHPLQVSYFLTITQNNSLYPLKNLLIVTGTDI